MDPGERINPSADWTHQFQCGCSVTWTGKSMHRKTMTSWCADHYKPSKVTDRNRMFVDAHAAYSAAQLNQPPM